MDVVEQAIGRAGLLPEDPGCAFRDRLVGASALPQRTTPSLEADRGAVQLPERPLILDAGPVVVPHLAVGRG